jgi:hypothetical protein
LIGYRPRSHTLAANSRCSESCTGGFGVLLGDGNGNFENFTLFPTTKSVTAVLAADVNGDGKLDALVGGGAGVLINISTVPTSTALSSSVNPSSFGQIVTYSAFVARQFGEGTPTGTVAFFDTATATDLGSAALSASGVASVQNSTLGPSTHAGSPVWQSRKRTLPDRKVSALR